MKTKVLFATLFATGLLFASCSKDEDPTPLTKDEANAAVTELQGTYETEFDAVNNNEGVKAYDALSQLSLPFVLPDTDLGGMTLSKVTANPDMDLVKKRDVRAVQSRMILRGELVFSEYVGTWEWNGSTWNHTSTPTDKIVVKFPYPSTNATNNAVYTISKYTLTTVDNAYSGQYNANLTIGGSEVWSVALTSSANVSDNSIAVSGSAKIIYTSLAVPKVSYEFYESLEMNMSRSNTSGSLSLKATRWLKKDGVALLNATFTISASGSNTSASVAMTGNITIANIRFEFKLSYSGAEVETPVENMTVNVYNTDGAKLGHIKLSEDSYGNVVATFVYTNGDETDARVLFGAVFDDIEDITKGFMDMI